MLSLFGYRETGVRSRRKDRPLASPSSKGSSSRGLCRAAELGLYDGSSNHLSRIGFHD